MTQAQVVATPDVLASLPQDVRDAFDRIINNERTTRTDWRAVIKGFIIDNGKTALLVFNTDVRGIRNDQFATRYCQINVPTAVAGSKDYKAARLTAQNLFNRGTQRSLDAWNVERGFEAKKRGSNKGKSSTTPAQTAPESPTNGVGEIPVVTLSAKVRELQERITRVQGAIAALLTLPKLPKPGVEQAQGMAEDMGKMAELAAEIGALLITGPDVLGDIVKNSLTAPAPTAPAPSTPQ